MPDRSRRGAGGLPVWGRANCGNQHAVIHTAVEIANPRSVVTRLLFGRLAGNPGHPLEGLPVDGDTRDAADRLAVLGGDHGNGDLVARLEHSPAPAAVDHVRRIADFGRPVDAVALLVLYVELEQAKDEK